MTDETQLANRDAGPSLDPSQPPASEGKRWAILIGFAAIVLLAAASINHNEGRNEPPAAVTAQQPAPASTNAVAPQPAPAPNSGG
jgi:hypothetical protein